MLKTCPTCSYIGNDGEHTCPFCKADLAIGRPRRTMRMNLMRSSRNGRTRGALVAFGVARPGFVLPGCYRTEPSSTAMHASMLIGPRGAREGRVWVVAY